LKEGEFGYEIGTGKYKIGDGYHRWNDLPYFTNEAEVQAYVDAKVTELQATVSGVSVQDLQNHVDSPLPHPVYDDGPSLLLLYENAKV
jgi:hypothetical protein